MGRPKGARTRKFVQTTLETKQCPKCRRSLPRAYFYRKSNRKDGLNCYCKDCSDQMVKDWEMKHSAKYIESYRVYHLKNLKRDREQHRKYYHDHRPEIIHKLRNTRINANTSEGMHQFYGVMKRPFPKDHACEICGKKINKKGKLPKLGYHHWGDVAEGQEIKGLWVCRDPCHTIIENPEQTREILARFETLKNIIDSPSMKESLRIGK